MIFNKTIEKKVITIVILFYQIMKNIRLGYYRYIGSGSSRHVFDLGNGYVVKVAKNSAGIAQNKCEYIVSSNTDSSLFAKVIKVSNDFNLLIMEKGNKINDISVVLNYYNVSTIRELFHTKELHIIETRYNLLMGDFKKTSSWGFINGRPTIIDYGFTKAVREKYY